MADINKTADWVTARLEEVGTATQEGSGSLVGTANVVSKGSASKGVYFDSTGTAQPMTYSLNANVPANPVIKVVTASFSSLSSPFTVAGLTANHILVSAILGTPSAQTSNWTVTTANNSFSISGSINGSTTLTAVFAIPTVTRTNV